VTMTPARETQPGRRPPSTALGGLIAAAAVSFAMASVIHAGAVIPLGLTTVSDPFPGAVIPEAVIAVVVAAGALAVLTRRPAARGAAVMATLFGLLGTAYGLTVTLGSARTGDIAFHVGILVVLAAILGLLLLPRGNRSSPA
jgi:hypothetical protein